MITVQAQNKIRASRTVTHWTARLHKTSRAPQVCQKKKKNPTPEQKKKSRRQHLCFTTLYKQQPINVTPKSSQWKDSVLQCLAPRQVFVQPPLTCNAQSKIAPLSAWTAVRTKNTTTTRIRADKEKAL